tara:strand:- start:271 stop:534 length:264 start_codon:yes stop_codon:yes gene_type:complete
MNIKNYVSLKSKSAVSFSKADDSDGITRYYLTQKRWDSETGTALADNKSEVELHHYESDKASIEAEISELTTKKDALTEIIKDIKAL